MEQMTQIIPSNSTDEDVISMWLKKGKANSTRKGYEEDIARFRAFLSYKPLQHITLMDVQRYEQSLTQGRARKARLLAAMKSLLTFCHDIGYTRFNVGKNVELPEVHDAIVKRLLTEGEVLRILEQARKASTRDYTLVHLLYNGGLRVSELCGLTWQDVRPNKDKGQVTVIGKGTKQRTVLLPQTMYQELLALRGNASDGSPVFLSRKGGKLSRVQVYRIVEEAAIKAGIKVYSEDGKQKTRVSPHWLRHAHATHYVARKGNMVVLQETLGHSSITQTGKYTHALPEESSALLLPF